MITFLLEIIRFFYISFIQQNLHEEIEFFNSYIEIYKREKFLSQSSAKK